MKHIHRWKEEEEKEEEKEKEVELEGVRIGGERGNGGEEGEGIK